MVSACIDSSQTIDFSPTFIRKSQLSLILIFKKKNMYLMLMIYKQIQFLSEDQGLNFV